MSAQNVLTGTTSRAQIEKLFVKQPFCPPCVPHPFLLLPADFLITQLPPVLRIYVLAGSRPDGCLSALTLT